MNEVFYGVAGRFFKMNSGFNEVFSSACFRPTKNENIWIYRYNFIFNFN